MIEDVINLLPFISGSAIETVLYSILHPVDVLFLNILFTVAGTIIPNTPKEYTYFVVGMWTQFVMLLMYDHLGKRRSKESVLLSALGMSVSALGEQPNNPDTNRPAGIAASAVLHI